MVESNEIKTPFDVELLAIRAEVDPRNWIGNCHAASLSVVRAELYPGARVARGMAKGVQSQHSWIVVGDPYDKSAQIIDPTLWQYREDVHGLWVGTLADGLHMPHGGDGTIWSWGRPENAAPGEEIELTPKEPLSEAALAFLEMLGPLDFRGWALMASAPVAGWPAAEIIAAMDDTKALNVLVPIDRLGMLTDRNPEGLYLP